MQLIDCAVVDVSVGVLFDDFENYIAYFRIKFALFVKQLLRVQPPEAYVQIQRHYFRAIPLLNHFFFISIKGKYAERLLDFQENIDHAAIVLFGKGNFHDSGKIFWGH